MQQPSKTTKNLNTLQTTISKILIIAPSWIGDTVMAQSLLKLLKQNNPSATIDILASSHLHPLLKRMPEVNTILTSPFKHGKLNLAKRFAIARSLKKAKYDQAIILPNSWKSALIPFLAKIPKRTGWRGEMRYFLINDIRILDKKTLPLMMQRFAALGPAKEQLLAKSIAFPQLAVKQETITQTLRKFNLHAQRPVLAFCIGAEYGETKRWPAHYFATIAKIKAQQGWDIWLLGGACDRKAAKIIQENSNQSCINLTGKTDLAEIVALLASSKIVVTNDTGLMHIAAALKNLPLIALYGSSSPQFTPPLTKNAKILSLNLKCSPCFKRECPLGHLKCMLDLTPKHILEALKEFKK